jgi:hypothetical protein
MHTARLHPKRLRCGPAQAHSDLLGATCGPHSGILLLALIGQPEAAPADEAAVGPIKLSDPPVTILTRAIKPWSETAEMAFGPLDSDTLRCPFFYASDETLLKDAEDMAIGSHDYVKGGTIGRPMKNCGLERLQARQLSHIDASETFTSCMHYINTYMINSNTTQQFC